MISKSPEGCYGDFEIISSHQFDRRACERRNDALASGRITARQQRTPTHARR